jgi:hypothetical protein
MISKVKTLSVALIFAIFSINAYAQTKVVVIPMAGDDLKQLANIVTVAKKNGDFTDPVAAMKSIEGLADENNRYLLVIAPGVYTLTEALVMHEYVDISGSGQNATMLTGAISSGNRDQTSALIQGANHTGIRSLSIENTGGATYSMGVYNAIASPRISDMTITVTGGIRNYGVLNVTSSPAMSNITISASSESGRNFGVLNLASSPTMFDMAIAVSGGERSYGIYNTSPSSPTMSNITILVSGKSISFANYGTYNSSGTSPTMSDMTIEVSGGAGVNYGIYKASDASFTRIRNSTISASEGSNNYSVFESGSGDRETYISDSILTGEVIGTPKCSFTFSETGTDLTANCRP